MDTMGTLLLDGIQRLLDSDPDRNYALSLAKDINKPGVYRCLISNWMLGCSLLAKEPTLERALISGLRMWEKQYAGKVE